MALNAEVDQVTAKKGLCRHQVEVNNTISIVSSHLQRAACSKSNLNVEEQYCLATARASLYTKGGSEGHR